MIYVTMSPDANPDPGFQSYCIVNESSGGSGQSNAATHCGQGLGISYVKVVELHSKVVVFFVLSS